MRPPDPSVIAGKLRPLGFKRYSEYLKSEHWLRLRREWLPGQRCECGAHATQLHHLTYERLGKEWRSDLEALCDRCHRGRHSLKPRRRHRHSRKPARGPETIPPDTVFERVLRQLERV